MRGDVTDDDSRAELCTLRMEEGARGQKMQMASTFWSRKEREGNAFSSRFSRRNVVLLTPCF